VVDNANRVHAREITIGADMADLYEIRSGLTANDKILLEGLRKVNNEDKIAYNYVNMKKVLPELRLHAE